jgi:hypothetical protein
MKSERVPLPAVRRITKVHVLAAFALFVVLYFVILSLVDSDVSKPFIRLGKFLGALARGTVNSRSTEA